MKYEVKKPIHSIIEVTKDEIVISRRRALDEDEFEPTKINIDKVVSVTFEQAGPLANGYIKFEYDKLTPLTNKLNFTIDDNKEILKIKEYVEEIIEKR